MKLICTTCHRFVKKKDTKVYEELSRIGTTNMHTKVRYRVCTACGTEVWDSKLENQNIKTYLKHYKWSQKQRRYDVNE